MFKKFDNIILIVSFYTCLNNIVQGEFQEGVEHVVGFDGYGDMKFPKKIDSHGRSKYVLDAKLWTKKNGILYLYSAAHYGNRELCVIKKAIELIAKFACFPVRGFQISKRCAHRVDTLRCVFEYPQHDDDVDAYPEMMAAGISNDIRQSLDYVFIFRYGGCQSTVGRAGGKQTSSLDSDCFYLDGGTVVHEMLHTLGYTHEHTRFDRDAFVKINFNNINPGDRYNFDKNDWHSYVDFGKYRYDSLMHYPPNALSKDPYTKMTIEAKKPLGALPMGQRTMLTIYDVIKIRSVTRCLGNTFTQHLSHLIAAQKFTVQQRPLDVYTSCLHILDK